MASPDSGHPSALVAITRAVSSAIGRCELTHLARRPIDPAAARAQHEAYEARLTECGCQVERLPADASMPDSVFVEDIAVVFDELAVVTMPGAQSRRAETPAVEAAVGRYRPLRRIQLPGTIDGGDVLVVGRRVFVGQSRRTNANALGQMQSILGPYGYDVQGVDVRGCLHLKSAVTAVSDQCLLVNSRWVDTARLSMFDAIDVDPGEPHAANALVIGGRVIYPRLYPRTLQRLNARGLDVRSVDIGELVKAEGAVTCCSLIIRRA